MLKIKGIESNIDEFDFDFEDDIEYELFFQLFE